MYRYVSSMPDYRDPDTAAAENLIIASYLLQNAGFADEAEDLADRARSLFEGIPYDKKKQARVLGHASCSPEGILTCRPAAQSDIYQVSSRPYDGGGEAEEAKRHASDGCFLKLARQCARDLGIGWLAAAQISSALSGRPLPKLTKSIAKAVTALYGAAAAADKAGWSETAAGMFRDAMVKNRVLDEQLGSWPVRQDAEQLSKYSRIAADEGSPVKSGGWILWYPPDVLSSLAASLEGCKGLHTPADEIIQSLRAAVPRMKGAWYPVYRDWDHYKLAEHVAKPAVAAASNATGIPMEDLEYPASDVASNISAALCRAMRAKRLADAYRVFLEAARRDGDTERLFLKTGFLAPACAKLPEKPEFYGNIAAAMLENGWRGYSRYTVRGERSMDDPKTTAFRKAALETSRASIREWFTTNEAKNLFAPLPGAYRNCPKPEENAGKEDASA